MKKSIILPSFCLLMACSHSPNRNIASLDNNTETLLDPTLESMQVPDEEKKFSEVGELIAQFVKKQSQIREQHAQTEQETLKDLPQVDQSGNPIPEAVKNHYATRDVHRKTHGCYSAQLQIAPDIREKINFQTSQYLSEDKISSDHSPEPISDLSQLGIFQPGTRYDAIVRYSNGSPGYRHDREPDARGMAVKILPNRLLADQVDKIAPETINKATLLDILTINFPTFFVNDPVKYFKLNEAFLKSSEDFRNELAAQADQAKAIFGSGLTSLEKKLALVSNGSIIYSPLFQKYYSMVPSRLGHYGETRAVKYSFVPEACPGNQSEFNSAAKEQWPIWSKRRDFALISRTFWAARTTPPFKENYEHDYLRQNAKARLLKGPSCFALMIQLYRDPANTNIEDSTDVWIGDQKDVDDWNAMLQKGTNLDKSYYQGIKNKKYSPYLKIATLSISQINNEYPAKNTKTCEDLSFSPWNGKIETHKPLGVVSRMKRRVYNASRRTRHTINNLPSQSWER